MQLVSSGVIETQVRLRHYRLPTLRTNYGAFFFAILIYLHRYLSNCAARASAGLERALGPNGLY